MVAALLLPQSKINFKSVLWNKTRRGIAEVLIRMGAESSITRVSEEGPEFTSDFSLSFGKLKPFEINKEEIPSLVDEIPILCVLATQANGRSIVHDADELRVKETDRIKSMVTTLSQMGAKIKAEGNTIIIDGPTPLKGAVVDSYKDHRTAMSLIVAGLIADGEQVVKDIDCINTSFPTFFQLLDKLGIKYHKS
jgi:3-phosphoshikimate 1-carboxyvinyltransferase